MNEEIIDELGTELYVALRKRAVVEPLTSRYPGITIDDAYRVSERFLELRIAAGESLVGRKIGLTNEAVQSFFHIDQPDFGSLTNEMQYRNDSEVPVSDLLIQPKIEGEIAFVLERNLSGPGVTVRDVLDATDYVAPCFEIVDSRVRDWRIGIADTIADNGSSGLFVMGDQRADPRNLDLGACEMTMTRNGKVVSTGSGAAALGSPLTCVAWLANAIGVSGAKLRVGDVILSGSLGKVISVSPDSEMSLSITGMGDVRVRLL